MLGYEVSVPKMKFLDMSMKINSLIVTQGELFMDMCVSEVVAVDQRANKEAEN